MPSVLVGNPLASGPQIIVSGNPWSGVISPVGEIRLKLDVTSSGNVYIGYSGNLTSTSGGMFLSGGFTDGMVLHPGNTYSVPRLKTGLSGNFSIFARHDAACSGQGRLWFDVL